MAESEKITINMSAVELGKVDLLVQESVYANRTDFIRTAIRNLLDKHDLELQQAYVRSASVIGVLSYNRRDLERYRAKNEKLKVTCVGYLRLERDIDPALALDTIEHIRVYGVADIDPAIRQALAGRLQ